MSAGEIVGSLLFLILLCTMAVVRLREEPRPSRFRRALWAESVRKRGLSMEEAEREAYVLGYIKEPPA